MLDDRMNRDPSPAIIHVRLRCCVPWMAAGTLAGWLFFYVGCVCASCACGAGWPGAAILRSVRGSLPCDAAAIAGLLVFCLQYLPWCYLLCDVVCDSSVIYDNVICGDVVSSGTAPSQSCYGWVASRNFFS